MDEKGCAMAVALVALAALAAIFLVVAGRAIIAMALGMIF